MKNISRLLLFCVALLGMQGFISTSLDLKKSSLMCNMSVEKAFLVSGLFYSCFRMYQGYQQRGQERVKQERDERFKQKELKCAIEQDTLLTAQKNSELFQVVSYIKNGLGIKEDIICILTDQGFPSTASYLGCGVMHIKPIFADIADPLKIFVLAYELEHHKQFCKYPGSCTFSGAYFALYREQGADKAAAKYMKCYECLKEVQKNAAGVAKTSDYHNVPDITSTKGYFTRQDFQVYVDDAQEYGYVCRGIKKSQLVKLQHC